LAYELCYLIFANKTALKPNSKITAILLKLQA